MGASGWSDRLHHDAHGTEHDVIGRFLLVGGQRGVEGIGGRFQLAHGFEPRRQYCLARGEFVGKRRRLIHLHHRMRHRLHRAGVVPHSLREGVPKG